MHISDQNQKRIIKTIGIFIPSVRLRHELKQFLNWDGRVIDFFRARKKMQHQEQIFRKNAYAKYNLAICAIMKNEGPYLREWIEYHRIIGVEKFFLYDNESNDDTREILKPYTDSGIVEYTFIPGEQQQIPAYTDCVEKHSMDTKWIAFIDLDEFIVPTGKKTILQYLDTQPSNVAQIIIKWAIFGSNGHEEKPDGLVIENYTMRAKKSWLYKAIVSPRMLNGQPGVHKNYVFAQTKYPKMSEFQINHYHCKSWAEYQKRANRGEACSSLAAGRAKYQRDTFNKHDKNEVLDENALRFISELKKAI